MRTSGLFSTRRLLMIVLVALVAGSYPVVATADNPAVGIFELDGDATDSNPNGALPDDWDTLFELVPGGSGQALVSGFIPDFGAPDDIFTIGSTKDDLDLSGWHWTTGTVPDKDDITNAYGALYRNPAGELVLVFGLDRYANNGDAQLGFWLFQDALYEDNASGMFVNGFGDTATHRIGDILILAHFTNGGATVSVEVYKWVGSGGSDGTLNLELSGALCSAPSTADPVCAELDSVPAIAPWPYTPKKGTDGIFPFYSFFEGAVNLAEVIPGVQCFSSFLAETRASQSIDSILKDFALATNPTCSVEVTKSGPDYSKAGDEVLYDYEICNTGIATLHLESAEDVSNGGNGTIDLVGPPQLVASECFELAPMGEAGSCCSFQMPYLVASGDPDPLENTVTVVYNEAEDLTGGSYASDDSWSVDLLHPEVTVTKTCSDLSKEGDTIEYSVDICNTGSDTALVLDSLDDPMMDSGSMVVPTECDTLEVGECCTVTGSHLVTAADAEGSEIYNTFMAHYDLPAMYDLPNDITDDDSCTTTLMHPGFTLEKTGDELSKVGDDVSYTITLTNTSDAVTPDLECTVTDAMLGIDETFAIASGDPAHVINASYTVPEGAPDPLVNTAHAVCSPLGFDNTYEHESSWTVNLFQPSITFDKSGDELSKVGDDVGYTITLGNTSSADTPDLVCTVSDAMLGIDETFAIASGDPAHVINATYTVQEGDPDPLENTAHVSCSPTGFPNVYEDDASWTVNLFQPSITFDKSGDDLSKVGDDVDYILTLDNTSSSDSPDLECTVTDTMLSIDESFTIASGDPAHVINATYTVQEGDADPLPNEASVSCSPVGFPNELPASDGHSVNLFQPSITLDKTGDDLSKVGDDVHYTITLGNTSSSDSPDLECSVTDPMLGIDESFTIAAGDPDWVYNATYTVPEGAPDPLVNTVEASCSPIGFPNVLPASASHTVNLFQPSIELEKTADTRLSKVTDAVNYTVTLNNTSSADTPDLQCTVTDAMLGLDETFNIASGASQSFNHAYTVQEGDPDPLVNTAHVSCSPAGFDNVYEDDSSWTVELFQPSVTFDKSGDLLSKVGDPVNYTLTLDNTSSADTPDLQCTVNDPLLGISESFSLPSGQPWVYNFQYIVPAGAPDPLVNVASYSCSPVGFPNVLSGSGDHTVNLFQPAVAIEKTGDEYSKNGDTAHWTITVTNLSSADSPPLDCSLSDPVAGVSETFTMAAGAVPAVFTPSRVVTEPPDEDPLVNTATLVCQVQGFPNILGPPPATWTTDLVHPSMTLDKSCLNDPVPAGASANFSIKLTNTGDVPLEVHVVDANLGIDANYTLGAPGTCVYDPDPSDGCLEIEGSMIAVVPEVTNEVSATWTLPAIYNLANTDTLTADATCRVTGGGATRTLGFWRTHLDYTTHVFNVHLGATIDLGWIQLNSPADVFGLFWSNVAKESDGDKRDRLCKARINPSWQALAAILNSGLSNGAGLPISPAEIAAILGGEDIKAIQELGAILDEYNNSGDYMAIIDADGYMIQPADPNGARDVADLSAADCP